MFPREHLPLTLVTVAILGILFIMYRELNALKSAVAHMSVPIPVTLEEQMCEEETSKEDQDTEDQDTDPKEDKSLTPALKSSKKYNKQS